MGSVCFSKKDINTDELCLPDQDDTISNSRNPHCFLNEIELHKVDKLPKYIAFGYVREQQIN